MYFNSIRYRIVLWYTLLLAMFLTLFSVLIYINLRITLDEDLNHMLLLKAEGVADSIETYWDIEINAARAAGASKEAFSKINNLNFIKIAQRWVNEQSNDPDLLGIIVCILGPNGKTIAAPEYLPPDVTGFDVGRGSLMLERPRFYNKEIQMDSSGDVKMMRVFSMPVIEDETLVYNVQVAGPIGDMESTLKKLRLNFSILLPVMVILSSLAGTFLAVLIIRPLKHIIGNMRRITAENLKLRIDNPDTKDEIKELVDTFNTMIEKLDASFSSQDQLIQDISHELRTPFTIMRGEIEVALKKVRTSEEYTAVLNSCMEEISRLSLLVKNLLVLSRFDSHEVTMNMVSFPMIRLITDIISDIKVMAEKKSIAIACSGSDTISVLGDEHQLRRALLNIIDNAIKYTNEGGHIIISLEKIDGRARIKLSDNGVGISEEDLPLIFNRFFRSDKSRSGEGYGLGLSISKSIIEAHNGRLTIESRFGRGTTVIIDL